MTGFHFIEVPTDRARQLAIASFVWLGLASIGVFLFFFNPALPGNQFFPKCPFRLVTGFQCPGCGSPRASYPLIHLPPIAPFNLKPLLMLTLPLILYRFLRFSPSAVAARTHRRCFTSPRYHF